MKLIVVLFFTSFIIFGFDGLCQDKIQMMNGRVLRGKIGTDYEEYFDFQEYKKGGKVRSTELSKYMIFSTTDAQGKETVLYKQDTLLGNFFSENEARMYIYGQRDARKSYKATGLFVGSFALGFTAVMLDTYEFQTGNACPPGFFHRTPSIGPIAVPLVITIGSGLIRSKVRKEYASDVSFLGSEHYIEGFQKIAKFKRLKNSFFGSVLGVASGFVVYSFAHNCP